jgi:hypothetical protein
MSYFILKITPKSPKGDFLHLLPFQIVTVQKPLQGFGVKNTTINSSHYLILVSSN